LKNIYKIKNFKNKKKKKKMKFNNILKGIICPLLFSAIYVNAKEYIGECLEIENLVSTCNVNAQGKIDEIVFTFYDGEDTIDKLLSYETITKLKILGVLKEELDYGQKIVDKIGALSNLENLEIVPFVKDNNNISLEPFRKLTNLKTLSLWYIEDGIFEKEMFDIFENVERL